MSFRSLVWIALSGAAASFCQDAQAQAQPNQVRDSRDGRYYSTVSVGTQIWFGENLAFDSGGGSRCFPTDPPDCDRGRLYDWPTAMEACPEGWRLPTEADWRRLEAHLGLGEDQLDERGYRGVDEGLALRPGGASGLNVELLGYMRPDETPRRRGERAAYWTATELEAGATSWHRDVSEDPRIYRSPVDHGYFLSVRCVR